LRWLILAVILVAAVTAIAIWVLRLPASLSAEEQKLVGKWTLPIGPQPPPNAIRQFFELKADRQLIMSDRLVATNALTASSTGSWRLEGDDLVFELLPPDTHESLLKRLLGRRPKVNGFVMHQRFLGSDDTRFRVECQDGVGTFERVVE
jgi:hypothetical protein